jgi:L-aminopeptidase/D-esterase-like protein
MSDPKIKDLTVSQLQNLIRQTVHEAVAEAMLELSLAATDGPYTPPEAEMLDYLRSLPVSFVTPHDD